MEQRLGSALRYLENRASVGSTALKRSAVQVSVGAFDKAGNRVRAVIAASEEVVQDGDGALLIHLEDDAATTAAVHSRAPEFCCSVEVPVRGLNECSSGVCTASGARETVIVKEHPCS